MPARRDDDDRARRHQARTEAAGVPFLDEVALRLGHGVLLGQRIVYDGDVRALTGDARGDARRVVDAPLERFPAVRGAGIKGNADPGENRLELGARYQVADRPGGRVGQRHGVAHTHQLAGGPSAEAPRLEHLGKSRF